MIVVYMCITVFWLQTLYAFHTHNKKVQGQINISKMKLFWVDSTKNQREQSWSKEAKFIAAIGAGCLCKRTPVQHSLIIQAQILAILCNLTQWETPFVRFFCVTLKLYFFLHVHLVIYCNAISITAVTDYNFNECSDLKNFFAAPVC